MRSALLCLLCLTSLTTAEFVVLDQDVEIMANPTAENLPQLNARLYQWFMALTEIQDAGATVPEATWTRLAQAVQLMAERGFAPGRPLAAVTQERPLNSAMSLLRRSRQGALPAIRSATQALAPAVRIDVPGEAETAWLLMVMTGMANEDAGRRMAVSWIQGGVPAEVIESILATCQADPTITQAVSAWVFSKPVTAFARDRQRLLYRIPVPAEHRSAMMRSAVDVLAAAPPTARLEDLWLPFLVLMKQSQFSGTLSADQVPVLAKVVGSSRGVVQRAAIWLACSADDAGFESIIRPQIAKLVADFQADDDLPAMSPGRRGLERMHGLLLFAGVPSAWLPKDLAVTFRQRAMRWAAEPRKPDAPRQLVWNAAMQWSLAARITDEPAATAQRLGTVRPEVFDELRLLHALTQASAYGAELTRSFPLPMGRKDLNEQQLATLAQADPAQRADRALGFAYGRWNWEGLWDNLAVNADLPQDRLAFLLGVVWERSCAGCLSDRGREYIRSAILPRYLTPIFYTWRPEFAVTR